MPISNDTAPLAQFLAGQAVRAQEFLGSHPTVRGGQSGWLFRVWAPHAQAVAVMGDFNGWDDRANPMAALEGGVWELFLPGLQQYDNYKYAVHTRSGKVLAKADPYAFHAETRPGTASKLYDLSGYQWGDGSWLDYRKNNPVYQKPMNIYEVHLGSWRRTGDDQMLSYRDIGRYLVPYVKEMGFTHVELLPVTEHPLDASWGYQCTGYFAAPSRFGTPHDFMWLVDQLHQAGIGVILDWVPAHFPKDAFGLYEFDGEPCYEYADPRKGEHADWGTRVFDYGRSEVRSFLYSSALFWLEQYHIDGLRVDAVASMLYLDYGRQDGQWVPNQHGGNQNLEAIAFFKHLNSVVLGRNQGAMMIAEESTAWPKVTGAPEDDGLGFSLKWNMGWMHDFTEYMKLDPLFRKGAHYQMTFSMEYAYSENYILVLSHDEVVHLKCSMLNKMPGLGFDKFANLKAAYAFMTGHPGKKLLFMGQEFAQLREWSEERELDWYLLAEEPHQQIQNWYRDLLHLYRHNKALYELDTDPAGFEWINKDDTFRSIFSFVRHSRDNKKNLLFVCNFTPMERPDYRVGVPRRKQLKLILDSDDPKYGGNGVERPKVYKPVKQECDGQKYSIAYPLQPYGVAVFEF